MSDDYDSCDAEGLPRIKARRELLLFLQSADFESWLLGDDDDDE